MLRRCLIAMMLCLLPLGAWAEPVRIVVFGDSLTHGYGLPPDRGFVPALQRWLDGHGADVRLVNSGLSGDTTYGGRVRIGWALRGGADGVIVELGGNDMLMGFAPQAAERNLGAIIKTAGRGGRPVLVLGIHPFGGPQALRTAWQAIWPRIAARHGVRVVADIYAGIRAVPEAERKTLLQRDRLHASEAGVATMVAVAGPPVLDMVAEIEAARP